MTRKEFLALVTAGTAAQSLAGESPAPAAASVSGFSLKRFPLALQPVLPGPAYLMAGPMLGHVGPSEARVWIRATAPVPWNVRVSESPALENAREVNGPALSEDSACTGIAIVDGLAPSTRYYYQILLEGRPQNVAPLPFFTTAPAIGSKSRQRIAFGSCVGDMPADCAAAWGELSARRDMGFAGGGFDLFLMLGDNHYGNTTEIPKLRTYYTAHRLTTGWREMSSHRPIYAIWDDHDYGPNNSDGTQEGKGDSLKVFREFWANPGCGEPDNPGCYFTFQRGDVQFFMLDGRYHRSPDGAKDGPDKTMFGTAQIAWLKRELLASKASVKLLANGSEWQSFGSVDSYSKYRTERDALLKWIEQEKIQGVILLSGDRHFCSGYHVLGRFVELVSSPLGSRNALLTPNVERFTGHDEGSLWMILDIDTSGAEPVISYEICQAGGGIIERRYLTWDQLHGRAGIEPSSMPLHSPRRPFAIMRK
jgi:alkaline phosphatase D